MTEPTEAVHGDGTAPGAPRLPHHPMTIPAATAFTLDEVDEYLARLGAGLRGDSLTAAGRARVREDVDALLERRHYLTEMESAC